MGSACSAAQVVGCTAPVMGTRDPVALSSEARKPQHSMRTALLGAAEVDREQLLYPLSLVSSLCVPSALFF